jgi:hypothetical protein
VSSTALLTTETVLQLGSIVAGATGIWERVGNGWQVSSLGYSLKKLATDGVQASEGNIHGGLMRLPLRLAFIGHENTCQSVKAYQQTGAGMRETAAQVHSPAVLMPLWLSFCAWDWRSPCMECHQCRA